MTTEEYKATIEAMGLAPCKDSFQGSTLHKTRDGNFQQSAQSGTFESR
jgi:hypothetical protein